MSAPPSDMGERLAALAGPRPWWPLVEPSPRWIRVRLGEEIVADSRRALLFVQYGPGELPRTFLPTYFLPVEDVRPGVLVDPQDDGDLASCALAGLVTFSRGGGLTWLEEDEPLVVHARDPHKRVDVAPSSRHVRVEVDGELLTESTRPLLLFETTLPPRYYLPPEDVRVDLLPSDTRSSCPYKGHASWWLARVGDRVLEDIAWSYPTPIPENPRIAGLICFRNERVDLVVDGEHLERPVTPWS